MSSQTYHKTAQYLAKKYSYDLEELLRVMSPNLISSHVMELPKKVLSEARGIVRELNTLSESDSYALKHSPAGAPNTPSVLCSLDAHLTEDNELKIIEVNTNASLFLLSEALHRVHGLVDFSNAYSDLCRSFLDVFSKEKNIAIVDEDLENQGLYFSLFFYQKVFEELGLSAQLVDEKDLTLKELQLLGPDGPIEQVYNRFCDFYLDHHQPLKTSYFNNSVTLSPNPRGYGLLADKYRLLQWQELQGYPHLSKSLLKTHSMQSVENLWEKRKQFFFKPPQSFGSKSVYNGKSVSKKVFERLLQDNYLAQQSAPAPKITKNFEGENIEYKYDLRFYFYKDQIQLSVARLYQGQVTNMKTPGGGIAPVHYT